MWTTLSPTVLTTPRRANTWDTAALSAIPIEDATLETPTGTHATRTAIVTGTGTTAVSVTLVIRIGTHTGATRVMAVTGAIAAAPHQAVVVDVVDIHPSIGVVGAIRVAHRGAAAPEVVVGTMMPLLHPRCQVVRRIVLPGDFLVARQGMVVPGHEAGLVSCKTKTGPWTLSPAPQAVKCFKFQILNAFANLPKLYPTL